VLIAEVEPPIRHFKGKLVKGMDKRCERWRVFLARLLQRLGGCIQSVRAKAAAEMNTTAKQREVIDPIDTVYLFGAGSVEGAWEPVLRALERIYGNPVPGDLANWWFSVQGRLIHLTSCWRSLVDQQLEARFGPGDHQKSRQGIVALDNTYRQQMRSLKDEIAKELFAAHDRGELRARENLLTAVATDAGEGSTANLTANWDLSLEKLLESIDDEPPKVLHLHGDIRNPDGMLLPGERPEEVYRDEGSNSNITSAYWKAINIFNYARRIYIAGLSLSPLDAALGVILGMGLAGNRLPGEIIVVNRNREETTRITNQVRMMIAPSTWTLREMVIS
jgi:hypothetical protein